MRLPGSSFWWLLRRSIVRSWEDGCLGIAKAGAYSALLSFFPVLTVTTAVLVQANAESVSRAISRFLFEVVPPGTEDLVMRQFTARGERPVSLLVFAGLLSLWAASGLTTSLMEGFDAAYHVPCGRSFLKQRLVGILLVFCGVLPSLGASALIVFGDRTEQAALRAIGLVPAGASLAGGVAFVGRLARFLTALSSTVFVTALMYYFGPNRPQKWRAVWPGAAVATAMWLGATSGFAWYVRYIANYNVLYGSVGAVVALLVWMYVMVVIALVGCEFNAELEHLRRAFGVPH
jgi:membrane protein